MTDVNLSVNCGCGYRSRGLEEAIKHSESRNHRMTIQGTITPTKRTDVVRAATPDTESTLQGLSEIDALRASINRRR